MITSASDFAKCLKALLPDDANVQEKYKNYLKEQCEALTLVKKNSRSNSNNIIIQLIDEYDCTSLGLVSNISFNKEVTEIERFILFGWLGGEDPLAIDKKSGEVVSLLYWDYDEIGFYCAQDSTKFLEAFLIHGFHTIDKSFERKTDFWAYNIKKANEAAKIAGGKKYSEFWMTLYPTDDGKDTEPNRSGFLN